MKYLVQVVHCTNGAACNAERPIEVQFPELQKGIIAVPDLRCSNCGHVMQLEGERYEGK